MLTLAGVIVGGYRWLRRLNPGGHGGELAEALWFRSGSMPLVSTIAGAVLSIVTVAIGASLGREAAPKQTGAAIASALASWVRLPPAERRLLAACGAGAGMGAVYNVPFGGAVRARSPGRKLALPLVAPVLATSLIATAVAPIAVFTALGALAIAYPELLGNGKDVAQEVLSAAVACCCLSSSSH